MPCLAFKNATSLFEFSIWNTLENQELFGIKNTWDTLGQALIHCVGFSDRGDSLDERSIWHMIHGELRCLIDYSSVTTLIESVMIYQNIGVIILRSGIMNP